MSSETNTKLGSVYNGSIALRVSVLGSFELTDGDGSPLTLRGRRARAILSMLALAAPRPVPRSQFIELLWSRKHKEQANASLRQSIAELHKVIRPLNSGILKSGLGRLSINDQIVWVDAIELERATSARSGALALLRGPLLDDFEGLDPAFDRWLAAERQRINDRARALAETALEEEASSTERITTAKQLLQVDPTNEVGWRALMASHAGHGDHAVACETYERCRVALAELTQRLPSPETDALMAHISRKSGVPAPPSSINTSPNRVRRYYTRLGITPLRGLDKVSEELVGGLTEEITTALGRFRGLSCVLLSYFDATIEKSPAWQDLSLDFVLDGSVQSSGGRVRTTARLLDMHGAREVIWSQRFDFESMDILLLRDEIASQTVAQVDPALMSRESYYAAAHRPTDATAYHLLLRAIPAIHSLDRAEFLNAGDLLAMAVARDSGYAPVYAWSAYWHLLLLGQGWAKDSEAIGHHLQELTRRAVSLDPGDARALTLAGHVKAFTGCLPEAMELHSRALSINPNLPVAWLFSGLAYTYWGQHEEAIRRIERAKRLSPLDPHEFFFEMGLTLSHLLRGDAEKAVSLGRKAVSLNPRFSSTYKCFLSALGYVGSTDERAAVLAHLLVLEPNFSVHGALERSPLLHPEDRALYAEGLRRAGLPEQN